MRAPGLALGLSLTLAACASSHADTTTAPVAGQATAIFAGGCFWCMEADFEKLEGVQSVVSGYAGGRTENPSYKEVGRGNTGHTEVVQVYYDPSVVSYQALLQHFWINVDPTTPNRQFCDAGSQYRAALMPLDESQREQAAASRQAIVDSGRFDRVVVNLEEPGRFWPAEDYHQDYYKKNPIRYKWYRSGCGRDARLEELWGNS